MAAVAAHQLGNTRSVRPYHPRDQTHLRPVKRHGHHRVRQFRDADRAGKILGLDPTLAAADHAAEQDMLLAGRQPDTDLGPQGFVEITFANAKNALRRRGPGKDGSLCTDPKRTEVARTPIHCNQGSCSWEFFS
jgi:hypothetical protein